MIHCKKIKFIKKSNYIYNPYLLCTFCPYRFSNSKNRIHYKYNN